MTKLRAVLLFVGAHLGYFIVGGLVAFLWIRNAKAERAAEALAQQHDALTAAVSAQRRFQKGTVGLKPIQSPTLAADVAAVVAAGGGAHETEHSMTTATIKDVSRGTFTRPPGGASAPSAVGANPQTAAAGGAPCSGVWNDSYNRFQLDLCSGVFTRSQLVKVEATVVNGLDPSKRYFKADVREFDPVTKIEIPNTGITSTFDFQFTEEKSPVPGIFHPILIFGFDHRLDPGVGVTVASFGADRSWPVSVMGFYDRANVEGRLVLRVAKQIPLPFFPRTNLSLGPYWGLSSKGTTTGGGAITINISN